MEHNKPIDTRFRLKPDLHEELKRIAKHEQRSMNYLMNKAVELLVKQETANARIQQAQKNLARLPIKNKV